MCGRRRLKSKVCKILTKVFNQFGVTGRYCVYLCFSQARSLGGDYASRSAGVIVGKSASHSGKDLIDSLPSASSKNKCKDSTEQISV